MTKRLKKRQYWWIVSIRPYDIVHRNQKIILQNVYFLLTELILLKPFAQLVSTTDSYNKKSNHD